MRGRGGPGLFLMAFLALLTAFFSLSLGSGSPGPREVFLIILSKLPGLSSLVRPYWPPCYEVIVLEIRLPRVLLAALVGMALACSGACLQGLFRNPLAGPYVLGLSSAAAFGACLSVLLGLGLYFGLFITPLLAFIMALASLLLVYAIARIHGVLPTETLVLAGIVVGCFFSALVSLMLCLAGLKIYEMMGWLFGSFWAASWRDVALAAPPILASAAVVMAFSWELNAIYLGEEQALHVGVDVELLKHVLVAACSLMTAVSVSLTGIIGFVGLVVPHLARLLVGADHRVLLPASCLGGAMLMVLADLVARTAFRPVELPVGAITALLGVPLFAHLLRRRKARWFGHEA